MIVVNLALILFFSFLLIKATDILLINLKSLSRKTKLGQFAITTFLLAFATSLPEFFVGITAAFRGQPSLSLGNVIGANIANLSLVIGGAALVGGTVTVRGDFLKKDVFYAFLAGAAPMVLLFDKYLSRTDGLILLFLYGFYNFSVIKKREKEIAEARDEEEGLVHYLIRKINHRNARSEIGWLFLGVALLIFSADMLVRIALKIAVVLNLPLLLVGLLIIAVGTTLPEFAFSLKAVKERHPDMVFGDLLGSIIANATLVIGLVALISPIKIQAFEEYLLATMAFVFVFGAFYYFIRTKHKLERWEGAFLIGFYLAFILSEFIHP